MADFDFDAAYAQATAAPNGHDPEPWPNMSEPERPEPDDPGKFPLDVLPGKVGRFVAHVADDLCGPPEFAAIGVLAVAGALAGSDVAVRPKRHASWLEHPAIWAMGIGAPGVIEKTPIFNAVMAPIWRIQEQKRQRWKVDHAAWKLRQASRKKSEPVEDPPPKPIIVVQDTTREALADAMADSHQTIVCQDELSDLIRNMARYTNGKGSDREFYLAAWSTKPHAINRVQRGWIVVAGCFLGIYGFTQPDVARECFAADGKGKSVDDGLLDRFGLVAFPDPGDYQDYRWRDLPPSGADPNREWLEVCQAIDQGSWKNAIELQDGVHVVGLATDAAGRFGRFVEATKRWQRNPRNKADCPYHGQVCKAPATVLRVALVLHVTRLACGEPIDAATLDLDSLDRAMTIYHDFAVPHYARLLGDMLTAPEMPAADLIEAWLRRSPKREKLQLSDVQRAKLSKTLRDRNAVADSLNVLCDRGVLRADPFRTYRGVPSSYKVNPTLWPAGK